MSGDERTNDADQRPPTNQVGTPGKGRSDYGATASSLARNPLGIIALFVVLIEAMASLLAFSSSFTAGERFPLICFIILFPVLVLVVFAWLVARHSGKLYAPSDYKNEDNYAALQRREIASVSTIMPKPDESYSLLSAPPGTRAPPTEETQQVEQPLDGLWLKPQSNWDELQYKIAMMRVISTDNSEGVEEINRAYFAKLDATEDGYNEKIAAWEAFIGYTRIRFGKVGSLSDLRALVEAHQNSSATIEYLARGLLLYEDYTQAAKTYEQAAHVSESNLQKLKLMGRAAVAHVHAGSASVASKIIDTMKAMVGTNRHCELELLRAIRDVAEVSKDGMAEIAAMERMVEIAPDDIDTRFLLAYNHAKLGHHDIALLHYLRIPYDTRNATVWNNIGVELENFSLSAKSVRAFRKSEEMGETLAMSNLAERFARAGFLHEAQQECDRALTMKDQHQNVSYTLARVKGLPDEEDKNETELLEKVKPKSDFYSRFGKAIAAPEPVELGNMWHASEYMVEVTITNGRFSANGSYEQPHGGLSNALSGISHSATSYRMVVDYSGKLRGRSVYGYVTRYREDQAPSLLELAGNSAEFLMILSEDGQNIDVMEKVATGDKPSGRIMRFYTLTCRDAASPSLKIAG